MQIKTAQGTKSGLRFFGCHRMFFDAPASCTPHPASGGRSQHPHSPMFSSDRASKWPHSPFSDPGVKKANNVSHP
jgi:hypothetical protein